MKRLRLLVLVLVGAAAIFGAGSWFGRRSGASGALAGARHAVVYTCPMHPAYRSDHPGDCPSCGMRLVPATDDDPGPSSGNEGGSLPPGSIRVNTERQQAIGVKFAVAERIAGTRLLRTTGRVVPRDDSVYPVLVGVEARVREVRSATVGTLVRRNEILASLYAPQILSSVQNYLQSLAAIERGSAAGQRTPDGGLLPATSQRATDALRDVGFSEGQIEELQAKRQPTPYIQLASPVDGFILQRNLLVGQRVEAGAELYRIADLRRVWVLADVYENQLSFLRSGAAARISANQGSVQLTSKVSTTQPIFDETARTMKVRLETDNPGFALKPGMFVDVEFDVELPPTLAVPADAVVDSGLRKTLFVDRGNGYFEPRQVETGWRIADQVEVLKGLMPGERIVVSGNFLLDSESRMKSAAQGIYNAETDPVCGMHVDRDTAKNAGHSVTHKDATYFFCSDDCKKKFEADPAKYTEGGLAAPKPQGGEGATKPMSMPANKPAAKASMMKMTPAARGGTGEQPAAATVKDLVCGMDVNRKDAAAAGRTIVHGGKTYYFCSDDCKAKFAAEPAAYVK